MVEMKKCLGKTFAFSIVVSENQDNLFTKNHTKFNIAMIVDGLAYNNALSTIYQCNPKVITPSFENVMASLYADTVSFDCIVDIDDFAKQFGITSISKAMEDYKNFESISNFMHSTFTSEQLEKLGNLIDNDWEADEIGMDL